jgi:hypothetical protein
MAAIPGSVGGDLAPHQRDANDFGHYPDVRPENENLRIANALSNQPSAEFDKSDSSVPTLNGHETRDTEKGPKADVAKDEQEAEGRGANIVDWDGPDDPTNPQNWYVKK